MSKDPVIFKHGVSRASCMYPRTIVKCFPAFSWILGSSSTPALSKRSVSRHYDRNNKRGEIPEHVPRPESFGRNVGCYDHKGKQCILAETRETITYQNNETSPTA